jgi:hypothetical protein
MKNNIEFDNTKNENENENENYLNKIHILEKYIHNFIKKNNYKYSFIYL